MSSPSPSKASSGGSRRRAASPARASPAKAAATQTAGVTTAVDGKHAATQANVVAPLPAREVIPLRQRPWDLLYLAFFLVNLVIITYIVDLEQLVITTPNPVMKPAAGGQAYPLWPPRWWVDTIHNYGRTHDQLLMARPVWWKVAIWYDVLMFGPLYVFFLWAFYHGKEEVVRVPAIIYGSVITTIVTTICAEEVWGPHAASSMWYVLALNTPWFSLPAAMIFRFWFVRHPFTRRVDAPKAHAA